MVWSVLDDDLRTPHKSIMFELRDHLQGFRKEVTDWCVFDWEAYKDATSTELKGIHEKWSSDDNLNLNITSGQRNKGYIT